MSLTPCDHVGLVRWPRVPDLSCEGCKATGEQMLKELGVGAPMSPDEWRAVREAFGEEDFTRQQTDLSWRLPAARASRFLASCRKDPSLIERLSPSGQRWAAVALAAEKAGPALTRAFDRVKDRLRETRAALSNLRNETATAWTLTECDAPFHPNPVNPPSDFEAEEQFLGAVAYLIDQRLFDAGSHSLGRGLMAVNTPGELRPSGPGDYLIASFVGYVPPMPLSRASRALQALYRSVLHQELAEDGARVMIARARAADDAYWEAWTRGDDSTEGHQSRINYDGVRSLRRLAMEAKSEIERSEKDLATQNARSAEEARIIRAGPPYPEGSLTATIAAWRIKVPG